MTEPTDADAELLAEAAGRFLRLREDGGDAARLALRRWMDMDVRRVAAIDMVERGWSNAGALVPAIPAELAPSNPKARRPRTQGRRISPPQLGWAAGLAATIFLLVGAEHYGMGFGVPRNYITQDDSRTIALVDGSRVRLQPHTQATVRLSLLSRQVALKAGSGDFTVAHETARPFVVSAGGIGVEATGTRFSVETGPANTQVRLWQGGVRLRDRVTGAVLAYMKPGDRADVGIGARLILIRAQPVRPVFVFENTPLADAVAQIGKSAGTQIRFARPDLARLPISSVYHGDDLEAFLEDLRAVEPICWRRRDTIIEIYDGSSQCDARVADR